MSGQQSEDKAARRDEEARLAHVIQRLGQALQESDRRLEHYAQDVEDQKRYLWESRADMDHVEKISSRESIEQMVLTAEAVKAQKIRLLKIQRSPYFGRFDFASGDDAPEPVYIGVHHFHDDAGKQTLVHDWRAPIASLFYDFETGPAYYEAPTGQVRGEIHRKRQFRIERGRITLMLDTTINVVDDVLQEALGEASDDAMRNIVATIQRDQNAIIRNDEAPVLVIQGVAGSGKTSIALHRIAYLLYRFKDSLTSEDILIISPNRVFADYIANVLPELGEETVEEMGMERLADQLLESAYKFQTFFEQTTVLLEKNDEALKERIARKASRVFLRQLDAYAAHVEKNRFQGEDLWIARRFVPGWLLEEIFQKHRSMGMTERLQQVVRETEQKIGNQYNVSLMLEDRRKLREAVKGMVRQSTLRETYRQFFDWLGEPELFRAAGSSRLEYADVFPLIYLKLKLEGIRSPFRRVKHLLIDEMQDYTPVQYAVMAKLFRCNKTILGDASQTVNPYGSSKADEIRAAMPEATCVTLNKSYRSTLQITQFAQRILPNPDLVAMERHGDEPAVLHCRSRQQEQKVLTEALDRFQASAHNTFAIICKTPRQARRLHDKLSRQDRQVQLFGEDSVSFRTGIIVCTAHMAKGLEFDEVFVPEVGADNYHTTQDRHLLYVACTRAMHRLTLTHTGEPTPLLETASEGSASG